MELAVKTLAGKAAGNITLDDAIFGIEEIRGDILQRTVRWQLAKRQAGTHKTCLLYTSPSPRDRQKSRMPSSA